MEKIKKQWHTQTWGSMRNLIKQLNIETSTECYEPSLIILTLKGYPYEGETSHSVGISSCSLVMLEL